MSANQKRRMFLMAASAGGLGMLVGLNEAQPAERIIKVVAKRFDYTPGEIHLKKASRQCWS